MIDLDALRRRADRTDLEFTYIGRATLRGLLDRLEAAETVCRAANEYEMLETSFSSVRIALAAWRALAAGAGAGG